MAGHYDNTSKGFTYVINKCDIAHMLLFTIINKVINK
jgi:hypothetical protein